MQGFPIFGKLAILGVQFAHDAVSRPSITFEGEDLSADFGLAEEVAGWVTE